MHHVIILMFCDRSVCLQSVWDTAFLWFYLCFS